MKLIYTGDFERLKEFGFEYDSNLSDNFEEVYSVKKEYQKLCILKNDGTIFLYEPFNSNTFILKNTILYDLIQAGLVKKEEEQTSDYLIINKNIIDVLDSIVWYNGIGDILLKLREDIINSEDETYSKLKYKHDEFSNNQFEIFWMMLVLMYGDYGTSPRSGWLNMENKNEIISFIDQITKTTKEDF